MQNILFQATLYSNAVLNIFLFKLWTTVANVLQGTTTQVGLIAVFRAVWHSAMWQALADIERWYRLFGHYLKRNVWAGALNVWRNM